MIRRTGTVVGLAGSASGLVGSLWNLLLPTPDANIGAGALALTGLVLCAGGTAIMCFVASASWITAKSRQNPASKRGRGVGHRPSSNTAGGTR